MRSYSVHKLVPPTVLSLRIVTKCRVTVYVLNMFVGNLSPAFRKIIRVEKTLYECCSWFFLGSGSLRDHHRILRYIIDDGPAGVCCYWLHGTQQADRVLHYIVHNTPVGCLHY